MFLEHLLLLVKVLSLTPFCKLALKLPCFYCTHVTQVAAFRDLIHVLSYQKKRLQRSPSETPPLQQGYFGSVLYTGDFRLHSQHAEICTLQMLRDKELSRIVVPGGWVDS